LNNQARLRAGLFIATGAARAQGFRQLRSRAVIWLAAPPRLSNLWHYGSMFASSSLCATQLDEQLLDFCSRPWGFAQKRKARFDAGVAFETTHVDAFSQPIPAIAGMKLDKYRFQRHAVEWVFGLGHGGLGGWKPAMIDEMKKGPPEVGLRASGHITG
jgi:hypothetical protein